MFTLGRDHGKKTDARYVRDPKQVSLLLSVIDAVHDLIEGKGSEQALKEAIRAAFTTGGSGVWENAEKWLRKSSQDYPSVLDLWPEFAAHPKAEVRFRVACVLNLMPESVYFALASQLRTDKSKKVAGMAKARIEEVTGLNAT